MTTLTFAIPKGRIYDELQPILARVGIEPKPAFFDESSRALQFATNQPDISMIRVRSFDVATFVAFGAAQLGVVGSDVLDEFDYPDLYAPVDLKIGTCRLSIAAPVSMQHDPLQPVSHIRVATKYPNLTQQHYAARGIQAECIKLNGAMELAPKLGLSAHIVDLVSTGNTLIANDLQELETIMPVSSRLIVNRTALKTDSHRLSRWIDAFREAVNG